MTLTSEDLTTISADIATVIAEHPLSVQFRRGALTLPAQTVRLVANGKGTVATSQRARATSWPLLILGAAGLDVQIGDRFNDYSGNLCVIQAIHPDRRAFTQAGADLAQ